MASDAEVVEVLAQMLPAVDSQVILAASELSEDQKKQPEWLWFAEGAVSFGRWQKAAGQAPYVRLDLLVAALSAALAAPSFKEIPTDGE